MTFDSDKVWTMILTTVMGHGKKKHKKGRQRVVDRVDRNKGVTIADVPGAQRSSVYL